MILLAALFSSGSLLGSHFLKWQSTRDADKNRTSSVSLNGYNTGG